VVGKSSMTDGVSACTASNVTQPSGIFVYNGKLIVSLRSQDRVLIWNTIPTLNNTPADVVLGQPNFITCDLLAQVEHFGGTGILVTNSRRIIELMKKRVESGFIIYIDNLEQACEAVNEIAPEHVEIMTQNPQRLLKHVKNAGSIFLGPYSPAVIGDYIAGPSHVLPTGGTAHYFSALSAADFIKSAQVISYTKEALAKVREPVRKLTEMEGLVLHRISLEARFLDGEIKKEKEEEINEIKKS